MFAQDRQSTTPTSVASERSRCSAATEIGRYSSGVEDAADCLRKLLGVEGLGQKEPSTVDLIARLQHHLLEITGNENNIGARTRFAQPICKKTAAHLRHDHVGKQKMNLPAQVLPDQTMGVIRIRKFDDLLTKDERAGPVASLRSTIAVSSLS